MVKELMGFKIFNQCLGMLLAIANVAKSTQKQLHSMFPLKLTKLIFIKSYLFLLTSFHRKGFFLQT
jgi:hypothetical protein